ncbi:PREDICTED: uncharacterized protein LOC105560988 isoform X2 [Vollenhovia emeryi]|uniref:uncharacterized protein LOC105560988 isoform X2 n=1 Tax=Vollenhovia emeryi TaxID=411798 RepID=UPI0005F566C4|nr:PREDICTED: uncharacterized protein LOC105560988 isoform X2 [Vollenhovia emeryi]
MLKPGSHAKQIVEAQVIVAMQRQGYTLNAVNIYDENLLHVSAANGCLGIAREILNRKENRRVVDRKNKFGWTPLMQAIRNRNVDTVKLLLEKNADVNQMTYLGMSVLGLAAAISREMFETVYNACPDALANTANDDITPLCVAAMKNDKELFLRLLELDGYTRIMMKRSTVPEIATLANEELATDDYWNDTSDNIEAMSEQDNIESTMEDRPTSNDAESKREKLKLHLLSVIGEPDKQISPNLTYDTFMFPKAADFEKNSLIEKSDVPPRDENANERPTKGDLKGRSATGEDQPDSSPAVLQRLQSTRPTDLNMNKNDRNVNNLSYNFNVTLGFTPEFSPVRSPHVSADVNEEYVFGENTPTPPRCKTPPKGILLNWPQTKMIMVLKRFGLSKHISVFLEQEVDFDLFLTLTDKDMIEIGIEHERDRCNLLNAIRECITHKIY